MGAKSRFDQPLTLLSGGNQVVACGPLLFDEDDVLAEVNISLTQPGKGTAIAMGVFVKNPLPRTGSDDDEGEEWMLTANVRPQAVFKNTAAAWAAHIFVPSPPDVPVIASGVIRYLDNHGNIQVFHWTGDKNGDPLEVQ